MVINPALYLAMLAALLVAWQAAQGRGGWPTIGRRRDLDELDSALHDEELWRGP